MLTRVQCMLPALTHMRLAPAVLLGGRGSHACVSLCSFAGFTSQSCEHCTT